MTKKELFQKIKALSYIKDEIIFLEIKNLLLHYLQIQPNDTEIWLKLIILEYTGPQEDLDQTIEYINKLLYLEPFNPHAILILAYLHQHDLGGIKETLFQKLLQLKDHDPEVMAMIALAKAWHFNKAINDPSCYKKYLIESISYSQKQSRNYKELGYYYLKLNETNKAKNCIEKALKNITYIYGTNMPPIYPKDIADVDDFFCERYKGTHTNQMFVDEMKNILHRLG